MFLQQTCFSQDQRVADSLRQIYLHQDLEDTVKFELLRNLAFNEVTDFNLALKYANELIALAEKSKSQRYLFIGYFQKGNKEKILGNLDDALSAYLKCITIAKESGNKSREGTSYGAIADVYAVLKNHDNAMLYYRKAIWILRQSGNSISLASAILNAGDECLSHQEYDSALSYFTESGAIFEDQKYLAGKAYTLGNIGMVYANLGKDTPAEEKINEAILLLEASKDFYPICRYLISMSDIYTKKGDLLTAMNYAQKSLMLAEQNKLKQQISDANLKMSELYEKLKNPAKSLQHYRNYIAYRDSVKNVEIIQKTADLRTDFEVSLKEKEIDLLEKQQTLNRVYTIIAVIMLVFAIVILLYFRQRFVHTRLIADHQRRLHGEKIENLLREQEAHAMQSLVVGREEERKRIAYDLHNHLGSLLATIKVNLNGVSEQSIPNYKTITSLVDQACSDVRGMSHSLNMGISEDFGLLPALKDLVAHLRQSGGLEVEFNASMLECQLDSASEIFIYRIIQELVSNVLKHAHATKLSILLTCFSEENLMNIIVHDNGKGFDLAEDGDITASGMGIKIIRQMVQQRQGDINYDSNAASGTTVNIDLPIINSLS